MSESKKSRSILWLPAPEEHNFPAAESYLSLLYEPDEVNRLVDALRAARGAAFKSKDIFRASGLSLLGVSNKHVNRDRKKIRKGEPLSPLLLVRDATIGKVVIADGYHRLCALYGFDEDAWVQVRIVGRV